MDNLSAQRRMTRDRIKSMITYHLQNVNSEIRFTDFCRLNRISTDNFLSAIAELIAEKKATRAGFYLVAGPHGFESYQIFAAVAAPVENLNIRFVESAAWRAA